MALKDPHPPETEKEELDKERHELLNRLQENMEIPMIILGLIWLVLLVMDLIRGLSPMLQLINNIIWVLFILDFLIKFILAPLKLSFLKKNVLTVISLAVPALRLFRLARVFRVMRTLRAIRGIRLVRLVGSINRGMRSLGATMHRRAFGYVLSITLLMLFVGAAGMYAFEKEVESGFKSYGAALWWTAMLLISIGSEYWPQTAEGRALCFLLSLYGFAVFGYFTAILASFFVGRDAENQEAEIAGAKQIKALHEEVLLLRKEIHQLNIQPKIDNNNSGIAGG